MYRSRAPTIFFLLALPLALPALADWDTVTPAKWVQLPDLGPAGIDIDCSPLAADFILADDFQCIETGPVTNIHIWGSWYHDLVPYGQAPDSVAFTLSIHADIPASQNPDGYGMPGDVLWTRDFRPGEFTVRVWTDGLEEGWMGPPDLYEFPGDSVCWQINFPIPPGEAFIQEGTPGLPVVYWLDVKAVPLDPEVMFGWKTSGMHWNDGAVFGLGAEPFFGPWTVLLYPPAHEQVGQPIDLAFVIASEPEPQTYKWEQPPDLTPLGIDVDASLNDDILADDFPCDRSGSITGIRLWGSWLNDFMPTDPTAARFTLSIHADIPASQNPDGYSTPGPVLWVKTFEPGTYAAGVWAGGLQEGWLNPPGGYFFPGDTICLVYDFAIPAGEAFYQEGSPDRPVVYWLDVKAEIPTLDTAWGWKTSRTHWNDDAVYGNGNEPYPGPWYELIYPPGHEQQGQSIGLAFEILEDLVTSAPEGDAPSRLGLRQNAPNPFNPRTEIAYDLPADGAEVVLAIFDAMGRRVRTLVDGFQAGGTHTVAWDGMDDGGRLQPAGVYFARLRAGDAQQTIKMSLVR